MNILLVAVEHIPPGWDRYGQFAGIFLSAFGYSAAMSSLRLAGDSFEARLQHARLQTGILERLAEKSLELRDASSVLDAVADEDKYPIFLRTNTIREERDKLQKEAIDLERGLISSAAKSRSWADLMLLLMVLGVAGGTALLIMQIFVVAPFVFGVAPSAYLAYRRLNSATKDASSMAHTERMRQIEYEKARLELDEKRLEIADQKETRELSAESRRIELSGKRHELHEKIRRIGDQ